jgi:hypothetical protein
MANTEIKSNVKISETIAKIFFFNYVLYQCQKPTYVDLNEDTK